MDLVYSFDSAKWHLGVLCKRQHAWPGTNQSLKRNHARATSCAGCTSSKANWLESFIDNEALGLRPNRLGKLCPKGHKWNDYSLSLRNKHNKCIECEKLRQRKSKNSKEYHKKYYKKNREKILEKLKTPESRQRRAYNTRQWRIKNGRLSRATHTVEWHESRRLYAAIRRAGKLPSVADLIQAQQRHYWKTNPDDRRTIMAPWKVQQAQWLYLTDQSYRLYQRQKSKHYKAIKRGNYSALIPGAQLLNRWAEFGHACAYCGKPDHRADELELEHVVPISKGGAHHLSNIVPACRQCNHSKFFHEAFAWYQRQPFYSETRWQKICAILNKEPPEWQQMRLIA